MVLVHGGGHGAWCWEPTLPLLEPETLAVDLPPTSIRGGELRNVAPPELDRLTIGDFAASVLNAVDAAGFERFVLVGHSLGGLTLTEVARRVPDRVQHLVFVSCMIPPEGGSAIDALPESTQEMTRDALSGDRPATQVGLDEATVRYMFCNDMDEQQTRFVLSHVGTEAPLPLGEKVTREAIPPGLPKTFVKLLRDQSLPPAHQDRLIEHLRAFPGGAVDVVEIDAGHDVMISQPVQLARVLNRISAG
jgi:pimeloyl-ACP methyl ester carboxylesterase